MVGQIPNPIPDVNILNFPIAVNSLTGNAPTIEMPVVTLNYDMDVQSVSASPFTVPAVELSALVYEVSASDLSADAVVIDPVSITLANELMVLGLDGGMIALSPLSADLNYGLRGVEILTTSLSVPIVIASFTRGKDVVSTDTLRRRRKKL